MTRASIVGMARSACYWALLLSPILLLPGLCRGCNENEYDIQEGCASCGDNARSDVGNTHVSGFWCESGYEKTSTGCLQCGTGKFSAERFVPMSGLLSRHVQRRCILSNVPSWQVQRCQHAVPVRMVQAALPGHRCQGITMYEMFVRKIESYSLLAERVCDL